MTIPFQPIANLLVRTLRPSPEVDLSAIEPYLSSIAQGNLTRGMLLTTNHYTAPDFAAWWFVITISSVIPVHIHWITSAGWTNSGWLTWATHIIFPIGARLLGFTPMPAMPPDPSEAEKRAIAVRQVLSYAHQAKYPVIGLAPEGGDQPRGELGSLPPGVGRFIQLLSQYCPEIIPVGVWKADGVIHLKFGKPYALDVPVGLSVHERDRVIGEHVMKQIAGLLPERLRGVYQ